ncbi:MAG TPA: aldose epimerase [Ruminococcaceae bacterium]|nr:aldose epimerase [Oscillospiraceae bacterium]
MLYTIENQYLTAQIDDMGAQLHSVKSKDDGTEYIWQGNPDIWYGQAPVLFPVIGQLHEDKFLYDGAEYPLQKHGFARKTLFQAADIEGARAVFLLKSSETTMAMFPFDFELEVCFELVGRAIKVTHTVLNTDCKTMYFSLGAHPGFNCEIGDYLEFEESEEGAVVEKIDKENIIIGNKFDVDLVDGKRLFLTPDLFKEDALIFSDLNSSVVTLHCKDRTVRFDFGDVPFLGIWAKPNAPYVCIEPWYGVNDDRIRYDDISKKRGIQSVEPDESFDLVWIAEV